MFIFKKSGERVGRESPDKRKRAKPCMPNPLILMVGASGFEPPAL